MSKTLWQNPAILLLAAFAFCTAAAAQNQPSPPTQPAQPAQKKPAAKPDPTEQAVLLGQFGDWGAYKATPGGKKICFALSKPATAVIQPPNKTRDPSYAFVSTRPTEKVKNEVSVIIGYRQKPGLDATAAIGSASYAMQTLNDGAWIKNAAEEAQMVDAMRKGADLVVKSESWSGAKTTDTYSLKGLGQALDKVAEECK